MFRRLLQGTKSKSDGLLVSSAVVAASLFGAAPTQCEGPPQASPMLGQRIALQAAVKIKLSGIPKPCMPYLLERATDTTISVIQASPDNLRRQLQAVIEDVLDADGKQGVQDQLVDSILPHLQLMMLQPDETRHVLYAIIAVLVSTPGVGKDLGLPPLIERRSAVKPKHTEPVGETASVLNSCPYLSAEQASALAAELGRDRSLESVRRTQAFLSREQEIQFFVRLVHQGCVLLERAMPPDFVAALRIATPAAQQAFQAKLLRLLVERQTKLYGLTPEETALVLRKLAAVIFLNFARGNVDVTLPKSAQLRELRDQEQRIRSRLATTELLSRRERETAAMELAALKQQKREVKRTSS